MPAENHPFSKRARHIDQWLWTSILLTVAITAVSLVNLGRISIFIGPSLFLITLTHHAVVLWLVSRDRQRSKINPDCLRNTTAPTATKANVFICWLFAFLWLLIVCIVLIVSVVVMHQEHVEAWERFAGYAEIPLECAEIGVLGYIAIRCEQQRKETVRPTVTITQRQQHMQQV